MPCGMCHTGKVNRVYAAMQQSIVSDESSPGKVNRLYAAMQQSIVSDESSPGKVNRVDFTMHAMMKLRISCLATSKNFQLWQSIDSKFCSI